MPDVFDVQDVIRSLNPPAARRFVRLGQQSIALLIMLLKQPQFTAQPVARNRQRPLPGSRGRL